VWYRSASLAYPSVRVELDLSNRRVDLVDEGFDLAIRIGGLHNDDVVAKPLAFIAWSFVPARLSGAAR
jgi:DNA-binding transcriptional LysR family regulator